MQKTSREYAEKLANEKFPSWYTEYDEGRARNGFMIGYLTAIEVNNVKGLQELVDEVLKVWNEDGENGEIQMKTPIAWYRVLRMAEALKKSKEV